MKKRPILFVVIAFLLGHLAASMQQLDVWLYTFMAAVLALSSVLLLKRSTMKLAGICLLLFIAGSAERYMVDVRNVTALPTQLQEASAQASGIIVSEVELDGDRAKFIFQSSQLILNGDELILDQSEKFIVHVTLMTEEELLAATQWHRGNTVHITGELSVPEEASNEGAFNYRLYLQRQSIHWLWKSKGSSNVEVLKQTWHVSSLLHRIDEIRKKLAAPLDSLYSSTESGYLKGLILGIREDLDPEQFRSFSTLGLTHILAISGLHVAVFMYMVTAMLKLVRCSKEQIIYTLLVAIPCYVALTGGSPSVLRAGMMAMIGLFAARAGRLKDGLHIIAVVAALLVLWDPYMLHDVSFQLSFIVTLGLIVGVPAIQCLFPPTKRWKWVFDLLAVTIVAQIISFPLTIYYFNQFHILSLLANFFLVPFISTIVMPLASIGLLLGHLSLIIARPVSIIVHWCNELSFAIVAIMGDIGQLHTIWASPPMIWIILWYSIWIAIFHYWKAKHSTMQSEVNHSADDTEPIDVIDELDPIYYRKPDNWLKRNYLSLLYTAVVLLLTVYAYNPHLLNRTATISFLDVGQGDASLIRTPTGKIMLVDGGGTLKFGEQEDWKQRKDPFEVGKKVLLPLLMKRGVQQIDILVLSHLDSDHIGGLFEVVRQIPVKEVWWNGSFDTTEDTEKLFTFIVEKQIPIRTPLIGETIAIDSYTSVDMLWPLYELPTNIETINKQNDQSLVFLLTVYDSSFLYTGDIGKETEELIVNMHAAKVKEGQLQPLPSISVLKAAHHGSRYSTDYAWLSYTQPQNTVISAGRNNRYGHPHPDVLDRLSQYNSLIWRIDQQGEVMFKVKKDQLYYRKWK